MKEFYTRKEVMEMLGITSMTLNRMMRSGKLKYYKSGESVTSAVRFSAKDLKEYLKNCKK